MGNLYIPSKQRIILCKETVAGTVVTVGGILGPASNIRTMLSGTPSEEHADLGLGVDTFSVTPVARAANGSFTEVMRADCIGLHMLMSMFGAGADAITGAADPYTHTGTVTSALPATYTAYHDTGQQTEYLQMPYATASQVRVYWSPTQAVMVDTQFGALLPTIVGVAPTIATRTVAKRSKPYEGIYTYQSGTAGTRYSGGIVSGDITFSRNCLPVITSEAASATDVSPTSLQMQGTMEIVYRGSGTNQPFADWLLWKEQGTTVSPNNVIWTPTDGHSVSISWWPMTLTQCDITEGQDNALHVQCAFTASSDLPSANVASPVITAPSALVLLNKISTAMA